MKNLNKRQHPVPALHRWRDLVHHFLGTSISRVFLLLVAGFLSAATVNAQNGNVAYPENSIDSRMRTSMHVDPISGALQFQITLGNYPGRAGAGMPIVLNYSSKLWRLDHVSTTGGCNQIGYCFNQVSDYVAHFAESSAAGWTSNLDWFIWPSGESPIHTYDSLGRPAGNTGQWQVARMFVRSPDGSKHELRRDDSVVSGNPGGGVYYAVDGSRLRYHTDTGTLWLPDGSRYVAGPQYIDRNGNTLSHNYATRQWTDTLGRAIGVPLPAFSTTGEQSQASARDEYYSIPGVGGASLTYTFKWRRLVDVRTDSGQALRPKGDRIVNSCDLVSSLFTSPGTCGTDEDHRITSSAVFNPVVLNEIVLPNGSAYTFTYNIYGEIDKVVYPTGGYEKFTHDQAPELSANFNSDQIGNFYAQANRGVYEQRISADGTQGSEVLWQYSLGPVNWTTAPDGTRSERRVHQSQGQLIKYGFDDPRAGLTYDERVSAPNNGPMLRRKLTEWAVDGTVEYDGLLPLAYKTRNPRPAREVEIILDTGGNALAATTTYQYDADLNVIATNRYAFVEVDQATAQNGAISAIPSGSLVRTEETTFLVNDPNIDASIRAAYRARNLLSLPTSTRVKEGNNIVAQSSISYDETALQNIGTTNGWIDPQTDYRGNATSIGSWLNTTNTYLTTHAQYDQFGNLRSATDAKGNQSQIEYSSAYAYAYPTLTRTAIPDPAGQHGANAAFVSTSSYDSYTGLVTATVDANNVTTTLEYNDVLNRPTRTVRASGTAQQSQTSVAYDDANHLITTTSDQSSFNDNALKSELVYDGLGRTIETRQYEGGTNYIAVRRQYDSMGRAYKTSNPFRPWQSEVAIWTTSAFDALGRVISMTTPDSAVVASSYSGNTVTVTDQTGKSRKSVTDALGRLAQVYEDPGGLNYLTSYGYDTLDNLTAVSQGDQTRSFVYDSFKRLSSATNPESGAVSYTYDNNGNPLTKTDARGVVSTYAYDALNRNTSVSYTNDPAGTPTVNRYYDGSRDGTNNNIPNSKGRLWQTETAGANGSRTTINNFDALGRPGSESQQFYANSAWSQAYTTQRGYNLAGGVTSQTYPSGHIVNYNYDQAGRLADKDTQNLAFTGTLGDGQQKTYSTEIIYSPFGAMTKEKFGTDPAIYNKLFYNSRGQLAEIREGTSYTGPTDTGWERGAIINYYSNNCWGMCGGSTSTTAMTDNNGNLKKQEVFVPGASSWLQQYDYDSLNRLQRVHENTGNTQTDWQQEYVYDRYGNRRIEQDATKTYGLGINKKDFTVNTANNRLGVPSGQSGSMTYDNAGNLTVDTYSGAAGLRAYDAENRMTKETQANSAVAGDYTYNAEGQRVRRKVNGVETWQVYGMDGELLAEYAANASAASPQKEYGYRNGQLLVTAEPGTTGASVNVALAANGSTVTASSAYAGWAASGATNGDRKGLNPGQDGGWVTAQTGFPAWLQVDFNGSKSVAEIDVFTLQDNYTSPSEPTETMTFSLYGLSGYEVQYWNGSSWVDVTGGNISGNDKVWRKFNFAAITTAKIRVLTNASPDGFSRLTEVEAWTPRTNFALASNEATASASSVYGTGYAASSVINGDRKGLNAGSNGNWNDAAPANTFPDWVEVDFNGSKTIDEIDVFTLQDNYTSPSEPTETMTFSSYGLTGYEVQYWNGSGWVDVTGGSITGNNKVWRKFSFSAITTSKIRVLTNASPDGWSRLTEVEAWSAPGGGGSSANINWLVTDQLDTPRIIFDQTGALANVKRHDYLPFGEELSSVVGLRSAAQGYGAADGVRQKFTQKERDNETGLDYFGARYFASLQGRFTSTDPIIITADRLIDPQEINLYNYARNNPLRFSDPTGEDIDDSTLAKNKDYQEWKKAYLSTKAGQAEWDKYNKDHGVTITITMGTNAGGKEGAETTPAFDANGKFTGATIVLGTDFAKGDSLNSSEYPISSSMTGTAEHSDSIISRTDRAVDFFAHEFGHIDDAQRQGKAAWERDSQLLQQNKDLFKKFGEQWTSTPEYKQLQSQCGCSNVSTLHTQREIRADAAVIPVMRDYYAGGAGHGSMPSRVKQAIQNYEKAYPR